MRWIPLVAALCAVLSVRLTADSDLDKLHWRLLKEYPARIVHDQPPEVHRAIRKHILVEGMTYGEAAESLGKPDILLDEKPISAAGRSDQPESWHAKFEDGKIVVVIHTPPPP